MLGQLEADLRIEAGGREIRDDRFGRQAVLLRRAELRVELEVDDGDDAARRERGRELLRVRLAITQVVPDIDDQDAVDVRELRVSVA